jgi:pyruvate,orthophosphate dikinase
LVSVRSGAARSMPGMLDTVLNVGCTSVAVQGLIRATGRPRLAWDCRRRFLESFGETVLGFDAALLGASVTALTTREAVASDRELDSEALERLAADQQALLEGGDDGWLEDAPGQLEAAARAVYRSWTSERAQTYRRLQGLDHLKGTAVTVQAMVFGNGGLASGAGVAFSRDPSSGRAGPVIDLVLDAQGEDVVSGRRTPDTEDTIARALPALPGELSAVLQRLEREFRDVQDVEFTVEDGKLWMLQTRAAKRTPRAALKIAIDLVHQGLIDKKEALARLADIDLDALVEVRLAADEPPVLTGIAASGGIAVGRAAFDAPSAERLAAGGDPVILMRPDTSTADVAGFAAAAGIVTAVGARTAHAALVARQMGKPCIVGCNELAIDLAADRAMLAELAELGRPIVIALNKIDLATRERMMPLVQEIHALIPAAEIMPISALKGDNLGELLRVIKPLLPESPPLMPGDEYTDQTERMIAAEIVREKIFLAMRQEIPFSTAVEIEQFVEEPERKLVKISALIIVEREAHKGMIIGAGGRQLKQIGTAARLELEEILGRRVFLETHVKVERGWTSDPRRLKEMGL